MAEAGDSRMIVQPTKIWRTASKHTHLPSFPHNIDNDPCMSFSSSASNSWRLENANSSPPYCLSSSSPHLIHPSDLLCECDASVVGRVGYQSCVGQTMAVLLRWTEVLLRKIANAYLGNWVLLMMVPCVLGVGLGFWWGRRWERQSHIEEDRERKRGGISTNKRSERQKVEASDISADVVDIDQKTLPLSASAFQRISSFFTTAATLFFAVASELIHSIFSKFLSFYFLEDDQHQCEEELERKEEAARCNLRSSAETQYESGVDVKNIPKHVAVIMDGNRRYGRKYYGSATKGHWDGSKTLVNFAKWCLAEQIQILTVYAFSTENWSRSSAEISSLMSIFLTYCEELRTEAIKRDIRIHVLSTDRDRIPKDVRDGLERMENDTKNGKKLIMNVCLSYGSRGEILHACKAVARDLQSGIISSPDVISEEDIHKRLLTSHSLPCDDNNENGTCNFVDPDIILRTSGEMRLSNFLLWQSAYSELFFVDKAWPEITKDDLLEIIRSYSKGRQRRYGK